ncbi:MAG TPA: acetamidase/formamidase family protein [Fimbriimonadaceae bacterium]|nr:acetamidase/formamidase family protein [Fimbriimonadaceae bacterium]
MADWHLHPTPEVLHGHFSRDLKPVLTVASGDRITGHDIPDAAWNRIPRTGDGIEPVKIFERRGPQDAGHCLMGPIAISGAEPRMTLEVRVEKVVVGEHGWTSAGGWDHRVHQRLGLTEKEQMLYWKLDASKGLGVDQFGDEVSLRPFLGVMGMPVDEDGIQPTPPPRQTGGNLDCKELVPGTTLYLPIEVPGGLFSFGDGHAAQGDGEVCVTAIECPIKEATLSLHLHPTMKIGRPRARVEGAWITLGVNEDLNIASLDALEEMVALMGELHGIEPSRGVALASVAVDMRVTQIVNGVQGVHAVLRDDAIRFGH